jgi:tRNA1Val (adenine37-N6)-methyltransferase
VSNPFRFQQFTVLQEKSAFKVGTDSVVLGAWSACEKAGSILDLGTGTGLLALMCAQKNPDAQIIGIDPDPDSLDEARKNFGRSPWSDRLKAINTSFQNFGPSLFDYIVCNPPYFNAALPGRDARKNHARHMEPDGFTTLARQITRWLNPGGIFGFILPEKEWEIFSAELAHNHLFLLRRRSVFPKPGTKNKVRILSEWSPKEKDLIMESDLFLRTEKGTYSMEYKNLTGDFYLKETFIGL